MRERIVFMEEYEPDFLCFNEIEAVKQLTDERRAQEINYLKSDRQGTWTPGQLRARAQDRALPFRQPIPFV